MNPDRILHLVEDLRHTADALEAEVRAFRDAQPPRVISANSDEWLPFDPSRDSPPWTPDPKNTNSDRRGKDLCLVIAFGQLYALNSREGRGASREEVRDFAIAGGYRDGRGISAWRGTAIEHDEEGLTWLTHKGHEERLLTPAAAQRLELPERLKSWNGGLAGKNGDRS